MKQKHLVNVTIVAGVLCILLGTPGPLGNLAGVLWPAALVLFAAAVAAGFRFGTSDAP